MNGSFVITWNHLDGIACRSSYPTRPGVDFSDIKKHGERFRLFDDDGILYLSGYCVHDGGEDSIFAPLDFAMAEYGCTDIQYRDKNGIWESI